MRIVVINFAASEGGALSILKDFSNTVSKYGNKHEWTFFLSDNHIPVANNIEIELVKKNRINRIIFDSFMGSKIINRLKPDVVINFQNTYVKGIEAPQIIYLHQPLPFQEEVNYSFFRKKDFKYAIIQKVIGKRIIKGLPEARKIIVQTQWMKQAVIDKTGILSDRIHVIPPTINIKDIEESMTIIPVNKLFFYPTSDFPYKNVEVIEEAARLISDLEFTVEITIDRPLKNKHLKSIGKLSRNNVLKKYRESILLFPSKIETFGMPLAEARMMGSPIIASDTVFSREILNDYSNVHFFNPDNPVELARVMRMHIEDKTEFKSSVYSHSIRNEENSWNTVLTLINNVGVNKDHEN